MKKVLWVITIIGCFLGGAALLLAILSDSAPKQGAAAAIAVAFAVIPYCLARAVSELNDGSVPKP